MESFQFGGLYLGFKMDNKSYSVSLIEAYELLMNNM